MRGHYRCYQYYITSTGGERIYDTIKFFPSKVTIPALLSQDKATDATRDPITILCNPVPATPFLEHGPKSKTDVEQLAGIFRTNIAPKQQNPSHPT